MFQLVEIEKKKVYTLEDYLMLPEGAPYQLIKGELVMSPSPSTIHQEILKILGVKLVNVAEGRGMGKVYFAPIDVYFSDKDVYQPDIIFISKDRVNIIGERKIEGAPDLIIEILSPATAYYDLRIKKETYEKAGVKEYWIIDPMEKIIEIYQNTKEGFKPLYVVQTEGEVSSAIIEGFKLSLRELFG